MTIKNDKMLGPWVCHHTEKAVNTIHIFQNIFKNGSPNYFIDESLRHSFKNDTKFGKIFGQISLAYAAHKLRKNFQKMFSV